MKPCNCPACTFVIECALTLIDLGDFDAAAMLLSQVTLVESYDDGYYSATPVKSNAPTSEVN